MRVQVYTLGRAAGSARLSTISSFFLRREFVLLQVERALLIFLQKNPLSSAFRAKTPASQFWSGIDFPSVYRKSLTCHSTHGVYLRLQYEDLKVRELFTNSSAMSLNSGSGAITGSKLMR